MENLKSSYLSKNSFLLADNSSLDKEAKITSIKSNCSCSNEQVLALYDGTKSENEEMTVEDLLKGITIGSANDATVALAERIGGSETNFVEMMNKKAKELGIPIITEEEFLKMLE